MIYYTKFELHDKEYDVEVDYSFGTNQLGTKVQDVVVHAAWIKPHITFVDLVENEWIAGDGYIAELEEEIREHLQDDIDESRQAA